MQEKLFDCNSYFDSINPSYKKAYTKLFDKYNLRSSLIYHNVLVLECKETFEKLGRKNFPKKATKTEYQLLSMEYYLNGITGILFFHDRVSSYYTKYGYIPCTMSCVSPDRNTRIVRQFKYIDIDSIYNMGGHREKAILDNLKEYTFNYCNGYQLITFIDNDNNSFDYSIKNNAITN